MLLLLFHLSCSGFSGFFPLASSQWVLMWDKAFHKVTLLKSNKIKLRAEVRVSTSLNVSWHLALKAFCNNGYHLFSVYYVPGFTWVVSFNLPHVLWRLLL